MEVVIVENELSSDVTGWPLESEEDYRGRTGVRGDEVVLAAPGVAVRPPWARADGWGLAVTEFDPGPAGGPGPVRFLGKWRTSPQPPHPLMPGPMAVVVLTAHGGVAPESAEAVDARVVVATPVGWRMCQAFWGLDRSWPSTVAPAVQIALAADPNYPAVMA
ncbi:hypothetical protein BJ969_003537 [Saccharopolyspora gloriosae]|uniref:Uncharacterized protein n=1 Tax=Saccharopolyspora gloriosae TaxID=455344 RepID=A0A840NME2_9PSEU|nr:hypothetical protein [Saccharopolyspora gloriosae]MBB5070449.1 hypothetical protein [Saccharopolyspora gloriosae]